MIALQGFTITTVEFAELQMNLNHSSTETKSSFSVLKYWYNSPYSVHRAGRFTAFPGQRSAGGGPILISDSGELSDFCLLVTALYWHRGVLHLFRLAQYHTLLVCYDFWGFLCFSQKKLEKQWNV